jgi:hypothetical protein
MSDVSRPGLASTPVVMRGLDPRIHSSAYAGGGMDRRVKPGDDNSEESRASPFRLIVMPGLVQGIHRAGSTMDRRIKSGDDDFLLID